MIVSRLHEAPPNSSSRYSFKAGRDMRVAVDLSPLCKGRQFGRDLFDRDLFDLEPSYVRNNVIRMRREFPHDRAFPRGGRPESPMPFRRVFGFLRHTGITGTQFSINQPYFAKSS